MKKMVAGFSIVIVSMLSFYVIAYIEGRINTILAIPPFIPAAVLSLVFSVFGFIYFFICWKRSLEKEQNVLSGLLMIILMITSVVIVNIYPTHTLRKIGLKAYISSTLDDNEWKNIRVKSIEIIGVKNRLPILRLCKYLNDTNLQKWNEMLSVTKIGKLGDWTQIDVRDNVTIVYWGGALAGHRGVSIFDTIPGGTKKDCRVNDFMTVFIGQD